LFLLRDAERLEINNLRLLDQNRGLREYVQQLEGEIAEMESSVVLNYLEISSVFSNKEISTGEENSKDLSPKDIPEDFFSLIEDIVVFSNKKDVSILESYQAFSSGTNFRTIVIMFESSEALEPPAASFIKWKQVSGDADSASMQELSNWREFSNRQPQEHSQLLLDFADPVCADVISEHEDIVAVLPMAYSASDTYPFEPALQIVKKAVGYDALGNPCEFPILNGYLTLSSGRKLKICTREGWFSPQMTTDGRGVEDSPLGLPTRTSNLRVGGGMSSPDCENDYGSLGGFATDLEGNNFFVTCEHVIMHCRALEMTKPKFSQSSSTQFVFPSGGPRKFDLIAAADAINPEQKLNANFLGCLLTKYETSNWKEILHCDHDRDITLRDVSNYLSENQTFLTVANSDIHLFSSQPCDVPSGDNVPLRISGDLAAVKISSELFNSLTPHSFQIRSKPVIGFVTLKTMFEEWTRGTQSITVNLSGANDRLEPIEGDIARPVHVKTPYQTSSRFVFDYTSKSLKQESVAAGEAKPKVLFGQYLISAPKMFGSGGDSGGMVYANGTDGMFIVGTFVGSLNGLSSFIATPADVLSHSSRGNSSPELQWRCDPPLVI
jgi:hypothetical protein